MGLGMHWDSLKLLRLGFGTREGLGIDWDLATRIAE